MGTHLVKWNKAYASKGLQIIDIDSGSFDTKAALEANLRAKKKTYATIWDAEDKIIKTYGVRSYPVAFLIGVEGKVIWQGYPIPELKRVERLIKAELAKVKPQEPQKPT